jgi:hypothetical protein
MVIHTLRREANRPDGLRAPPPLHELGRRPRGVMAVDYHTRTPERHGGKGNRLLASLALCILISSINARRGGCSTVDGRRWHRREADRRELNAVVGGRRREFDVATPPDRHSCKSATTSTVQLHDGTKEEICDERYFLIQKLEF